MIHIVIEGILGIAVALLFFWHFSHQAAILEEKVDELVDQVAMLRNSTKRGWRYWSSLCDHLGIEFVETPAKLEFVKKGDPEQTKEAAHV